MVFGRVSQNFTTPTANDASDMPLLGALHMPKVLSPNLQCGMLPPPFCEVPNTFTRHQHPFSQQQCPLRKQVASVAAEFSACGDYAVAGNRCIACFAHDVADRAMGARTPCGRRNVAISSHPAMWDSPHNITDPSGKIGASHHCEIVRLVDCGTSLPRTGRPAFEDSPNSNESVRHVPCNLPI